MKRAFLIMASAVLIAMIIAGCGSAPKDVVAKVGKEQITLKELDEVTAPMQARWKTLDEAIEGKKSALDNLIQQKLLVLGAYKEGLDKDSLLLSRVAANDERRKITALWEVEIAGKIEVTDQMVEELYQKRGTEYNAAHILVKEEALAKEIEAKAKAGEDFAKLAEAHSIDPGSAQKGGDLGWFTVGRMVKPFEDAVLALKDGEISAPVATNYGFHIIKRIGSRTRSQEPLEKAKETLRTTLERELQGAKSLEFVDNLFKNRGLTFDEKAVEIVVEKHKVANQNPEAPAPIVFDESEKALTVAKWDTGVWTIASLDSAINMRPAYQRQPLVSALDVENFIKGNLQGEFLIDEADKIGVVNSDQYKEMYKKELEELMSSTFQNQSIYGKAEVTDAEVQAYYAANPDSFMEPRTVVTIEVQLDKEADAQDIATKVKGGADILKFVEQKSLRTYTKNAGGVLEITDRRFPDLYAAVSAAKVGDIVGPVKDRTNRFSVMKVTEIREAAPMPLEKVSGRIQSTLRRTIRDKAMADFVESAKKEFGVKVFEKNIIASIDASLYQTEAAQPGQPAQPVQAE